MKSSKKLILHLFLLFALVIKVWVTATLKTVSPFFLYFSEFVLCLSYKLQSYVMIILLINILCVYFRNIREAWIKAKYVERRFVKQLAVLPTSNQQLASPDHRSSRQLTIRKWSVRKLRRRPRSRDSRGERKSQPANTLPSVSEGKNSTSESKLISNEQMENVRTNKSDSATSSPKSAKEGSDEQVEILSKISVSSNSSNENVDVLLFGKNFEKQPLEDAIELSSDQDSTGGEEDEIIGMDSLLKSCKLFRIQLYLKMTKEF